MAPASLLDSAARTSVDSEPAPLRDGWRAASSPAELALSLGALAAERGLLSLCLTHDETIAATWQTAGAPSLLEPSSRDGATLPPSLLAALRAAARVGAVVCRRQTQPDRWLVAIPLPEEVAASEHGRAALVLVVSGDRDQGACEELARVLAELAATWLLGWQRRLAEEETRHCLTALACAERVAGAADLGAACRILAQLLQTQGPCVQVAIGVVRDGGHSERSPLRLVACSSSASLDAGSELARDYESALSDCDAAEDESLFSAQLERIDAVSAAQVASVDGVLSEHPAQAPGLARIARAHGVDAAARHTLRDTRGRRVGAVLLIAESVEGCEANRTLLRTAGPLLAETLAARRAIEGGRVRRGVAALERAARRIGRWGLLAGAAVLLALAWLPIPDRIRCDCQLEPVRRRFVAAPFAATLETCLAHPGDVVSAGDVLARLDGRELRWERAGLAAELGQARKRRDAAQAKGDYAEAQIAGLEIEGLELKLELLDHRVEQLELRSPVDGVVASGDLERAEGAPLQEGQSLFEIAPLEAMIVEVAVPDARIAELDTSRSLQVQLDAFPQRVWQTTIERVQPRGETRDERQVFIAEGTLDNRDAALRPGMKGRARVDLGRRAAGWVLLHRPWERLARLLAW